MNLELRFDRLEQANRQWRLATMALGVLLALMALGTFTRSPGAVTPSAATTPVAGSAAEPATVLRARQLLIVDDKGNTVIELGTGAQGSAELSIVGAKKQKLL